MEHIRNLFNCFQLSFSLKGYSGVSTIHITQFTAIPKKTGGKCIGNFFGFPSNQQCVYHNSYPYLLQKYGFISEIPKLNADN